MVDINTLSQRLNTRTLHLILLSMASCGVWPLLWLYKNKISLAIPRVTRFTARCLLFG